MKIVLTLDSLICFNAVRARALGTVLGLPNSYTHPHGLPLTRETVVGQKCGGREVTHQHYDRMLKLGLEQNLRDPAFCYTHALDTLRLCVVAGHTVSVAAPLLEVVAVDHVRGILADHKLSAVEVVHTFPKEVLKTTVGSDVVFSSKRRLFVEMAALEERGHEDARLLPTLRVWLRAGVEMPGDHACPDGAEVILHWNEGREQLRGYNLLPAHAA